MWYIFQLAIIGYIGYKWTTLPGNSPENLGHGLVLGVILAWYATLMVSALFGLIRPKRTTPVIAPRAGLLAGPKAFGQSDQRQKKYVGRDATAGSSNKPARLEY